MHDMPYQDDGGDPPTVDALIERVRSGEPPRAVEAAEALAELLNVRLSSDDDR